MRGSPCLQKIRRRLLRRVEVFGKGQPFDSHARFLLNPEQAQDLVDTKHARRVSKYRIELTKAGEFAIKARAMQLSDRSAKPGPWLQDGVAAGNRRDIAILEAWA